MVASFGCSPYMVEDIVQEMYIRMYKYVETPEKILYEGEQINTFYIYVTLRNMYIDYAKVKKKIPIVYMDNFEFDRMDNDPVQGELLLQDLTQNIWAEIDTWYWYDQKMLRIYLESNMSMRDISRETTISLRSIFNTIKNGKERIRDKFKADYDSYKEESEG